MLARSETDWVARAARRRVSLPAVVHQDGGSSARGQVSNVSYDGCHLLTEAELYVGEGFTLELPGKGKIAAQVRWRDDIKYGVRLILDHDARDARRARIGV